MHLRIAGLLFVAIFLSSPALSAMVLADFESNTLAGWSTTGTAWTVGGTTNTTPNILPLQGGYFARSGAPNAISGPLAESNIGTVTSPAFVATSDTLTWQAVGWSGSSYNGASYFQILDGSLASKAQVATPQSDAWSLLTLSLSANGIALGETFYFRAVDDNNAAHYAWLAFDDVRLIPEPSTWIMSVLGLSVALLRKIQ